MHIYISKYKTYVFKLIVKVLIKENILHNQFLKSRFETNTRQTNTYMNERIECVNKDGGVGGKQQ